MRIKLTALALAALLPLAGAHAADNSKQHNHWQKNDHRMMQKQSTAEKQHLKLERHQKNMKTSGKRHDHRHQLNSKPGKKMHAYQQHNHKKLKHKKHQRMQHKRIHKQSRHSFSGQHKMHKKYGKQQHRHSR